MLVKLKAMGIDVQIKLMHKLITDVVEDARLHKTSMASIIGNGIFVADQITRSVYNQALDDFKDRLLNWKPQDEEYRNFSEVVNEIETNLYRR